MPDIFKQLRLLLVTLALMWINATVGAWSGGVFVLAICGGWAISQYDDGRTRA